MWQMIAMTTMIQNIYLTYVLKKMLLSSCAENHAESSGEKDF